MERDDGKQEKCRTNELKRRCPAATSFKLKAERDILKKAAAYFAKKST